MGKNQQNDLYDRLKTSIELDDIDTLRNILLQTDDINIINNQNENRVYNLFGLALDKNKSMRSIKTTMNIKNIIDILIASGADINTIPITSKPFISNKRTLLMVYGFEYSSISTKILLDAGADINIRDAHGKTAIMHAARKGWTDSVKLLIEAGADVNDTDEEGQNAFMSAVEGNNRNNIIKVLIDAGADINGINNCGRNVLHIVSSKGNVKLVELLVKLNVNVNVIDELGSLPLHNAAYYGSYAIMKMLIKAGSDFYVKNNSGYLPMDMFRSDDRYIGFMEPIKDGDPKKYNKLYKELSNLYKRIQTIRLKKEDIKQIINTDFGFDI